MGNFSSKKKDPDKEGEKPSASPQSGGIAPAPQAQAPGTVADASNHQPVVAEASPMDGIEAPAAAEPQDATTTAPMQYNSAEAREVRGVVRQILVELPRLMTLYVRSRSALILKGF
jgi:hypothetical protein